MKIDPSSVRLRATIAATLVVAVALGAIAVVLVVVLRGSLTGSADAEASRRAGIAVEAVRAGAITETTTGLPTTAAAGETASLARTVFVGDPDLYIAKATEAPLAEWAPTGSYAVAAQRVTTPEGAAVLYARVPLTGAEQALQTLNGVLLPGVPALLILVAVMTWFSVNRALAPVGAIRAKLAHITARDLHERVPVPQARDEIAALAATVNGTLDRLETSVETHKRFVADAAHELRSPIATLRARLELAEPSELTAEALADVARLQSLAADLLLLARLDAGEPPRTTEVDLGQVALEESLRISRRPDLDLDLEIEPDVVVRGSRGHLDRLVTNLVDNAVRHASTRVLVSVRADGDQAVLQVHDDGPGIPPEQREAVFDRFTRLDEARARDAGGAGLGLPIARDIALLHDGTLTAEDGGFVATFPAARLDEASPAG